MIKVGESLPAVTLHECPATSADVCIMEPVAVDIQEQAAGKTIALFGVPGAFTPTCSDQHVPSYLDNYDALKAAGVDEIWCVAVNDAFVMGAWGRDRKAGGKIRMLADGNAEFAKATGLTLDASGLALGTRSQRYSMLLKDGKVLSLNVEDDPTQATVSDGATLLAQVKQQA